VLAWNNEYPNDELILVVRRSHRAEAASDVPSSAAVRATSLWPQGLAAAVAVRSAARSADADLVVTHNFACRAPQGLSAVFLHDVLFATNPEWFTIRERVYFSFMRLWLHRADFVFTSSKTEAQRITDITHAHRVFPVGLGLSTELTNSSDPDDPDRSLAPGRFLLSVGRLNARKNLGAAIDGALRSGRVSTEQPLVIVGSPNGKLEALHKSARRAVANGLVRFVGFVSERRLRWYYRNTSLFLFLSLGEGFGMPAVEAAFFGARVLVSDLPVFRENLGDRAGYVDPTDTRAVGRAIAVALDAGSADAPPRRTRGRIASQYDWSNIVQSMRNEVLSRKPVGP
jgi:glycosyltransferase involved in cell wall biosynthesis